MIKQEVRNDEYYDEENNYVEPSSPGKTALALHNTELLWFIQIDLITSMSRYLSVKKHTFYKLKSVGKRPTTINISLTLVTYDSFEQLLLPFLISNSFSHRLG